MAHKMCSYIFIYHCLISKKDVITVIKGAFTDRHKLVSAKGVHGTLVAIDNHSVDVDVRAFNLICLN